MGNYSKDNRSGGRSFGGGGGRRSFGGGDSRGGRGGYGGRDEGRPQMHEAVCDECGQRCEVPFRPTGDKPVFCRDCFKNKEDSSPRRPERRDSGRSFGRSNFEEKRMYKTVCDECGNECEVPFQPTGGKPIYCSQCFDKGDNGDKGGKSNKGGHAKAGSDQFKEQFEMLNIKLDRLIKILTPVNPNSVELIKNKAPKLEKPKTEKVEEKAPEKKAKSKKVSAKKKK